MAAGRPFPPLPPSPYGCTWWVHRPRWEATSLPFPCPTAPNVKVGNSVRSTLGRSTKSLRLSRFFIRHRMIIGECRLAPLGWVGKGSRPEPAGMNILPPALAEDTPSPLCGGGQLQGRGGENRPNGQRRGGTIPGGSCRWITRPVRGQQANPENQAGGRRLGWSQRHGSRYRDLMVEKNRNNFFRTEGKTLEENPLFFILQTIAKLRVGSLEIPPSLGGPGPAPAGLRLPT